MTVTPPTEMSALLETVRDRLAPTGLKIATGLSGELQVCGDSKTETVVVIECYRGEQRSLSMMVPLCHERRAKPRDLLRLAASLGAGAIALVASTYVVRYSIPGERLEEAPLEGLVHYLGGLARELREKLCVEVPNDLDNRVFDHFA